MTGEADEKPDLADLLARLDELRQAERRAVSARMVSVAGHLVGTPLNVIAGRAALIRTNASPEAIEENVRRIEEQVERLALRIRRLIDYFGLVEAPAPERALTEVLDECMAIYRPVAQLKRVTLELKATGIETFRVDGAMTQLVLSTLISLAVRTASAGQSVNLTVSESGPKLLAVDILAPGLEAPPKNFERLEPPEHGVRYDAGTLEALWTCLGMARRAGGALTVVKVEDGSGVNVRFECAHS
jgi:signal transduction histidine kinase